MAAADETHEVAVIADVARTRGLAPSLAPLSRARARPAVVVTIGLAISIVPIQLRASSGSTATTS
jgi:hypothetical protein